MPTDKDKVLLFTKPSIGMDPELFLFRGDSAVSSSEAISEGTKDTNGVNRDGIQVEFNPEPAGCRIYLKDNLSLCFRKLRKNLAQDTSLKASFSQSIKIEKKDFDKISDEDKLMGCNPSANIYGGDTEIKINPLKETNRFAGGHIHIGKLAGYYEDPDSYSWTNQCIQKINAGVNVALSQPTRLVRLLDYVVGNTCVLLDRGPEGAERRKHYGRAGEHRHGDMTPHKGLEYRTLSNFWLRSYPLMSLVTGLVRISVLIVANDIIRHNTELEDAILSKVDPVDVKKAINNNDDALAQKNFDTIKHNLADIGSRFNLDSNTVITNKLLPALEHFMTKPMTEWFPRDPMDEWEGVYNGTTGYRGWENFCAEVLRPDIEERKKQSNKPTK